ncbi:hypothetical protein GSI_12511 [Ganoderma sinense ZZ0214-1]|uniref:DUF6533 domain-containing protein n=1 Tax=Ganoderma sinense ZZ0214-1 TaxID=1077348 RepID=A0A2G8RSY7_9APHY|nr:hypothetical protein GSI_12511 [Ganoderma sinense ZZ0214-1]
MSSQDGADIVALYKSIFVGNCCGIGGSVFLIYEYLISIGDGINLFATSKITGASILYLTNIIIPFVTNAMALIGFTRMSDKVRPIFCLRNYIPWATFSALRAYALSEHLPLAILTLFFAMVSFSVNLVQYGFGLTGLNDPTFGCSSAINLPQGLSKKLSRLTIVSRTCLISSDAIVIAVTWYTMPRKHHVAAVEDTPTFAGILLRNGTVYFGSLLILNALHLTFTLVAIDLAFENVSYMTMFTEPVTAVLVSRFLLDLQAANRKTLRLDSQDLSQEETSQGVPTGSLIFNRVVGSLGSSILPGSSSFDDTDDTDPDEGPFALSCDPEVEKGKERSSETGSEDAGIP